MGFNIFYIGDEYWGLRVLLAYWTRRTLYGCLHHRIHFGADLCSFPLHVCKKDIAIHTSFLEKKFIEHPQAQIAMFFSNY